MKRPEEEVRQKTTNKTAGRKEHQIRPRAAAEEKHDPSAAQAWTGPPREGRLQTTTSKLQGGRNRPQRSAANSGFPLGYRCFCEFRGHKKVRELQVGASETNYGLLANYSGLLMLHPAHSIQGL